MDINERRSSVGRSTLIDASISIVGEILKNNGNTDEIVLLIMNNMLPNEIRSIVWRFFLNIFQKGTKAIEWVNKTKELRAQYSKLEQNEDIQLIEQVLRKEKDVSVLENMNSELKTDYEYCLKEFETNALKSDFFKSEIVAETLIRLYLIWKKENKENKNPFAFHILAVFIYALYPCILHFTGNDENEINVQEDITPKTLFYFLNSEEDFDADIYTIFDETMKRLEKTEKKNFNSIEEILKFNSLEQKSDRITFLKHLNRPEYAAYFLTSFFEASLPNKILEKSTLIENISKWQESLLISLVPIELIVQFWDIVFSNDHNSSEIDISVLPFNDSFHFIDYLIASLIGYLFIAQEGKSDMFEELLNGINYSEVDLRKVLKMALKLREKVDNYLINEI